MECSWKSVLPTILGTILRGHKKKPKSATLSKTLTIRKRTSGSVGQSRKRWIIRQNCQAVHLGRPFTSQCMHFLTVWTLRPRRAKVFKAYMVWGLFTEYSRSVSSNDWWRQRWIGVSLWKLEGTATLKLGTSSFVWGFWYKWELLQKGFWVLYGESRFQERFHNCCNLHSIEFAT